MIEFVDNGNFFALPAPDKMNGSGINSKIAKEYNKDNNNGIRRMVAYHGSGADFDRFDHSFMGSGKGEQAHGWGTYVTKNKTTAKLYANEVKGSPFKISVQDNILSKEAIDDLQSTLYGMNLSIDYDSQISKEELIESAIHRYKSTLNSIEKYPDHYLSKHKDIYTEILNVLKNKPQSIDIEKIPNRHFYEVEIPDDNENNYLDFDDLVSSKVQKEAKNKLYDILSKGAYKSVEDELREELDMTFKYELEGRRLYYTISSYLGSDKDTSLLFHDLGFVGIKYEDYFTDDNGENIKNYVIFDENDLEIINHTRYMRASNGSIYGVSTPQGLFVNIKPEDKIGDCTDLFLEELRLKNPNMYNYIMNNPETMEDDLMYILRQELSGRAKVPMAMFTNEELRNMTYEELVDLSMTYEELGSIEGLTNALVLFLLNIIPHRV